MLVWCLHWPVGLLGSCHGSEHIFDPTVRDPTPDPTVTAAGRPGHRDRPPRRRGPDQLPDPALAERALALGQEVDRLHGQWLRTVAAVDGRRAAGAECDQQPGSTAAWLRGRLRMGTPGARSAVRTTRALFRGPLAQTGQALCAGEVSPEHARVLAEGTQHLPTTSPKRPSRFCSTAPGGWTRPGCARP